MSSAIQFLETLGRKPMLAGRSIETYVTGVCALEIDDMQRRALLARDPLELGSLLGGRSVMAMHIATPDGGDEPQEAPDRHEDDEAEKEEKPRRIEQPD